MKMRALKDFLDPYASVIHVVGAEFELPDENLCDYLAGMGTLEYADAEEPAPVPVKKSVKPAPSKAELSSGVDNG